MKILKVSYRDGEEFLRGYQSSFAHGGAFVPTRKDIPIGEAVVIAVQIGRRQNPLLLRATVAWRRRGKYKQKVRAGLGLEFHASERGKRDFLLSVARGLAPASTPRRYPRLPVDLPVRWRPEGALAELKGTVRDIGRGGALVVCPDRAGSAGAPLPAAPGGGVTLNLWTPGAAAATPVDARVAWIRREQGETGFGVSWRARDAGGTRRLRELVRRLSTGSEPIELRQDRSIAYREPPLARI